MFGRRATSPAGSAAAAARGHCAASGCRRRDGLRCSYIDKRGRSCPTAWCQTHVADVAGIAFCRRHATTMAAIEGSEMVIGLPDIDNRAASLASWVARDLDAPVRRLFTLVAPTAAAAVIGEPVRLTVVPGSASHRWAKTWKLVRQQEVLRRVSIEVDEIDDTRVVARVGTELIGRGRPPWIENRLTGRSVDSAVDAAERRKFTLDMARSIELVVTGAEIPEPR